MMAFHVGQKVVCVSLRRIAWFCEAPPIVGQTYTIREIRDFPEGAALRLVELHNTPRTFNQGHLEPFFLGFNFRPVKTTSISVFTQMLAPKPVKKREPA